MRASHSSSKSDIHTVLRQAFEILWHIKRAPQRRGEGTSYKQQERHLRKQTKLMLQAKILVKSLTKCQILSLGERANLVVEWPPEANRPLSVFEG